MSFVSVGSLKKEFTYISQHDPALDKDHADFDFEAYLDNGSSKALPTQAGHTLTVFHLKKLPPQVVGVCSYISAEAMQDESKATHSRISVAYEALRYGLTKVDNMPDLALETELDAMGRKILTQDTVDNIWYLNPQLFLELGDVIISQSMGLGAKKKSLKASESQHGSDTSGAKTTVEETSATG